VSVVPSGAAFAIADQHIVTDDNSNGEVDAGESVRFNLQLQNVGTSRADGLTGTLSSSDSLVTISDDNANFSSIGPQELAWSGGYQSSYAFRFSVDAGASSGHSISFSLTLTDELLNSWEQSFAFVVQ